MLLTICYQITGVFNTTLVAKKAKKRFFHPN